MQLDSLETMIEQKLDTPSSSRLKKTRKWSAEHVIAAVKWALLCAIVIGLNVSFVYGSVYTVQHFVHGQYSTWFRLSFFKGLGYCIFMMLGCFLVCVETVGTYYLVFVKNPKKLRDVRMYGMDWLISGIFAAPTVAWLILSSPALLCWKIRKLSSRRHQKT